MGREAMEGFPVTARVETAACFSAFLFLGIWNLSPAIAFGDSGEFIAAGAVLGLAHSPGYPLHALLAKALGTALPLGSWAYRVNLVSALCAAAALALLGDALRLSGAGRGARLAALAGLGGSPLFRRETAVAEVFALNALALSAMIWLCARYAGRLWEDRPAAALGLTAGLALANHHTALFAIPAVLLEAWLTSPASASRRARGLCVAAAFALAGLAAYLYLPIRSFADPPLDWGDPTNWERFWRVMLRRDYGSFSLTVEGAAAAPRWRQFWRWGVEFVSHAGLAAIPAVLGLFVFSRARVFLAGALLLAGPFFFWLGNPPFDAQTSGALERFYLAPLILSAVLAALAVHRLFERAGLWVGAALAALLLHPAANGARAAESWFVRRDYAAYDYGRSVMKCLPPGSVLAMDGGDDTFYTTAALRFAEGLRPDLALHDRGGLVFKSLYGPDFRWLSRVEKEARRREVETALARAGTLHYSTLNDAILPGFPLAARGLVWAAGGPALDLWPFLPERWEEGLARGQYRYRALIAFYPVMRAFDLERAGRLEEALAQMARAAALAPDALWISSVLARAAATTGLRAADAGSLALARRAYSFVLAMDKRVAEDWANLGALAWRLGEWREAETAFSLADTFAPGRGYDEWSARASKKREKR